MPTTPEELSGALWTVGIFFASVATWMYLGFRVFRDGTVLRYEPRRPVPWNVLATMLAGLYVVMGVLSSTRLDAPKQVDDSATAAGNLAVAISSQLVLVGIYLVVVALVSGANRDDLGLPRSYGQIARDKIVGVVACLAAYLPVGIVAILVFQFLGMPEPHPMIRQIKDQADPLLLAVGFVSAVVVAPVCEEIVFRLLLQGWLEKWEDLMLGWRTATGTFDVEIADATAPENFETEPVSVVTIATAVVTSEMEATESVAPIESPVEPERPPAAGVGGMPHGALPILVSSTLFAWAHIGHSTDPFPLFVLSLFLGFVYQRTHRITASITLHAMFNLISMLVFWLTMFDK